MRVRFVAVASALSSVVACATEDPFYPPLESDGGLAVWGYGGARPNFASGGDSNFAAGGSADFAAGGSADFAAGGPQASGGSPFTDIGSGGRSDGFGGATGSGDHSNANAGGRAGSGGTSVSNGEATGSGGCGAGSKVCSGVCSAPRPNIGCGTSGCDPCPSIPDHAYAKCTNGTCDWDCLSGYTKSGKVCNAPPGSGGSGSGGGSCNIASCPSCSVIFGPACCNGSKCGCPLIPWTAGALGCL